MRSQLLILSMISLAVSGCGKSVERNAVPVTSGQGNTTVTGAGLAVQPTPSDTRPGHCVDPISTHYKKISRFAEIAAAIGEYKLERFDTVGLASGSAGSSVPASAISVVTGELRPDGMLTYTEKCRDLSAMPQGSFQWGASAPLSIAATSGQVKQEIRFAQVAYGPGIVDPAGAPRQPENTLVTEVASDCASIDENAAGVGCAAAEYYQIDATTIGVLRTANSAVNGTVIQSKIFARYSLAGGEAPRTKTAAPRMDSRSRSKHGGQGKDCGQGKNGGQGTVPPTTKLPTGHKHIDPKRPVRTKPQPRPQPRPIPHPGNGGQGNGDCGACSVPIPPPVTNIPLPPPVTTVPVPTTTIPTETSKTKTREKVVIVTKTAMGSDVTKIKHDTKEKTNAEAGTTKTKEDLKIKETSPEETLKVKASTKDKTNAETGVEKHKSDLKVKEKTEDGTKLKIKVRSKVKAKVEG